MEEKNKLIGALIGLVRSMDSYPGDKNEAIRHIITSMRALARFEDERVESLTQTAHEIRSRMHPDCATCQSPCGRNDDYDMSLLSEDPEDLRAMKIGILDKAILSSTDSCFDDPSCSRTDTLLKALFFVGEYPVKAVLEEIGASLAM